jgi:glycine/D-amino acid oxidase-like deaminating enzyme
MTDLLTHEEYRAVAASLDLPQNAWIDGGYRPAVSGRTFDTVNPATGALIGTVAACGAADVDPAVARARQAFEDGRWSRLHPGARKDVLVRLAKLMERNARVLAVMESIDSGKTIHDCESVDIPEAIHVISWRGELIDKIYDQVSPASKDHIAMVVREPVGVVGLVLPWNFPLLMLAWQIDPALAVTVVDAGRVADSSAGRNSGFMIDLPHELTSADYAGAGEARDRVMTRLNRQAIDLAASVQAEYGLPAGYFQRSSKINGAASEVGERANRSYAAHLPTIGEPHEMLDPQAMRAVTGSTYYRSGLFTPGTAVIQPAGYIRGLAAGLEALGVMVFESSPVTAFASTGAGWRLTTPQGLLTAAKVILANNGHLESFGFHRGRLMHIMLNACMTQEIGADALRALGGHDTWGLTPSDPMGCTVRRISTAQGGDRIVIRQGGYYRPAMQTSAADLARVTARMRVKFDARFPALASLRFEYAWSGHLCLTRNAVSVMRELEPGLFSACVQNGLGTTRGTLTGIGAAELATGQSSEITRFFTMQAEPARLPPHPFDSIGANAYLRFKEWQARAE